MYAVKVKIIIINQETNQTHAEANFTCLRKHLTFAMHFFGRVKHWLFDNGFSQD